MKEVFEMVVWQGFLVKAAPTVVTGVVGVAAYGALRKAVAKVPLREATVTMTAWGLRAVREAERKAEEGAEHARLTVADVMAEARERVGEEVPPLRVVDSGHDCDH
ncbi:MULTISPECIES: DUF1490 family protein [Mycobacterium]|jgi:hypothetical protein|uniref:DUF1490 domain-containing protein n=1 Tax=Mycobacterium kiyosense TaxID=2871094 RepID=A0AA37V4C4_9MYCO|nr:MULTISPECIES: DUF1490 family protein [Mycobacterium]BDE17283.1 hypothetical protein MKCMC460_61430 [Mycobacterium sp. 20KCMC460]GLB86357.1 hypothetical protein SRL2020028_56130 [Mycobacterium kiyosense]GLB91755.1 hypothetical protein SRL2020130_45720 [Mycobacterium kiyosense]GLB98798.1 hypothetical protein SRL2020226_55740 [Mycobacterium kiyosense]GLC05138.1 hypothetical protein SRL2020400_57290 [Mycobacterium kiyosense]